MRKEITYPSYERQYTPVPIPAWVVYRLLNVLEKCEQEEVDKEYKKIMTGLMVVVAEAYARFKDEEDDE